MRLFCQIYVWFFVRFPNGEMDLLLNIEASAVSFSVQMFVGPKLHRKKLYRIKLYQSDTR